nr:MAG TPA: hypothetical protein [Caudoviricetes sp.]
MIEKELRANWDSVFYPEPEPEVETFGEEVQPVDDPVLLAAGPSGTVSDAGAAFGVFPQMKPRRAGASEVGANLPLLAADVAAGAGKGIVSGVAGFPGDIAALGRGLYEIGRRGGDQSALDAFLQGMEKGFILPTSDDVDKWLTQNIGPVVPEKQMTLSDLVTGGPAKTPLQGAREAAAGAGRFVGEVVADPFVAVKGAKAAAKGVKSLRPSSAQSNLTGVSYATTQEGPFYRVSKAGNEASPTATGEGRVYPGTVIENRAGSGRPSVYGDAPGQADQELQVRLDPESNAALRVAEQVTERTVGQPYRVDLQIEPSSLKKQSPVCLAYDLAASRAPGYDKAVFNAYKADPEYGPLIERLGLSSYDDLVKAAYQQLEKETVEQFNALPIRMSYHRGGEGNYLDSKEMLKDVHLHNHLFVYQGGDRHEFLNRIDPSTGLNSNEMFRAVQDYFGHAIKGNTFGPVGEEVAWASHAQMYSPLARIAMTAETRGQNSFVNYTPINAELVAQMENVRRAMVDSQRSGNTAKVEEYKQLLRDLGGQWQYAQQASVALPPEMTKLDYSGQMPEYLRSIQSRPGESLPVEHYSRSGSMTSTDPSRYGSGAKGMERERLEAPGAKRERTFFYEAGGRPEEVVVSQAPYKYKGIAEGLYDFDKDPQGLRKLARVKNTSSATAKYNPGVLDEAGMANDLERMIFERGFKGYVTGKQGSRVVVSFEPVSVEKVAPNRGAATMPQPSQEPQ